MESQTSEVTVEKTSAQEVVNEPSKGDLLREFQRLKQKAFTEEEPKSTLYADSSHDEVTCSTYAK